MGAGIYLEIREARLHGRSVERPYTVGAALEPGRVQVSVPARGLRPALWPTWQLNPLAHRHTRWRRGGSIAHAHGCSGTAGRVRGALLLPKWGTRETGRDAGRAFRRDTAPGLAVRYAVRRHSAWSCSRWSIPASARAKISSRASRSKLARSAVACTSMYSPRPFRTMFASASAVESSL